MSAAVLAVNWTEAEERRRSLRSPRTKRVTVKFVDCCDECTRLTEAYWHHLKTHPEAARLRIETHWPNGKRDGTESVLL